MLAPMSATPFGGRIGRTWKESEPWRRRIERVVIETAAPAAATPAASEIDAIPADQ